MSFSRRLAGASVLLLRGVLLFTLACGASAQAAEIRGFVADVRGGERLERVRLRLLPLEGKAAAAPAEALTNSSGEFALENLPAGEYELIVSTVGYRLFRQRMKLAGTDRLELEIALSPEAFTQRETIEVSERVFEPLDPVAPAEQTLTNSEVKNLGSVLADDPLRAVQAMPGVAAGDDFESRFSLRGADFRNIGIYLDGVLLHQPFHTVHTNAPSGSLTILNGDLVDTLGLLSGGFSARYGDRTAGALAIHSREGGRLRPTARATASASNAGMLAEGPLGPSRKGSWMAAVRKSYLDYIIRRTSTDDSIAFGFLDGQGRLVYDLTPRHQVSFHAAAGDSALDRSSIRNRLGLNAVMETTSRLVLGALGFRYAPGPRLLVDAHLAELFEQFRDRNREGTPLESGRYRETAARADATWYWAAGSAVEFGGEARRAHDEGVRLRSLGSGRGYDEYERYRGGGWLTAAYAQQSWAWRRFRLGAGLRWDRFSSTGEATLGPRASLSLPLPWNQSLHFGWGQYSQFPEQRNVAGTLLGAQLSAERSTQYLAAWEWQFRERTRARVEFYNREDRNGLFRPVSEPRLLADGRVFRPLPATLVVNSLRGYSRGVEVLVQRRSANRLTGWVSYSYEHTHLRDTLTGLRFPYDYDQPHTFNAYGSYRVRPSVNLSGKWLVGSGFPITAFLRLSESQYFLAVDRSRLRLDSYQRLDLRINKSFHTQRRRFTLYGEVINVLNRRNLRFSELSSYNATSGAAYPHFDRMFPIIPSAGLVFEF